MKRPIAIGLVILAGLGLFIAHLFGAFRFFPPAVLGHVTAAPSLALYSLDPSEGPAPVDATNTFRDYLILGQTVIGQPADRQRVTDSLRQAARWARDPASCFNPRHGIRVTGATGTYDLLLCFECRQAVVFFPDGHREAILIHGPSTTLDQFLTAAQIPLQRNRQ